MARFRLANAARADLAAILDTSRDRWGEAARNHYSKLMAVTMRTIAAAPEGPLAHDRNEVLPGARSFHLRHAPRGHGVKAPVHVVYHRIDRPGLVVILRVLHERMKPLLDGRDLQP